MRILIKTYFLQKKKKKKTSPKLGVDEDDDLHLDRHLKKIKIKIIFNLFGCADFEDTPAYQLSLVEDTNAIIQLVVTRTLLSPIKLGGHTCHWINDGF